MDLWVVAAAAGAGYMVKNLQNSGLDKKEVIVQSEQRNLLQKIRDKACPLRRLAQKTANDDSFMEGDNHLDDCFSDFDRFRKRIDTESGMASSMYGSDAFGMAEDSGMGWIIPGLNWDHYSKESSDLENGEIRNFSKINDKGKIVRSRRRKLPLVRPLSYAGSCIDAHLIRDEHGEMDEKAGSLLFSVPTLNTFLFGDGSRRTNKPSNGSSCIQIDGCTEEARNENGLCSKGTDIMARSSVLERYESVEDSQRNPGTSLLHGPDGILLFIIGMTIGILCSTMASQNEVDKLNMQLKQTQNLVEDLHEELDMKEVLVVEELPLKGKNESPPSVQEPIASPSNLKVKTAVRSDHLNLNNTNEENHDAMSKIEAELQAELEMLEQNMKVSALQRISDFLELDPDFEPILVQGDLNSTMANHICVETSESGHESTDTTTHISQPANFMVSPWELSLRLHELIESRLEARIKELEIALANSQNTLHFLSSQTRNRFSYDEAEERSSTSQSSPTHISQHDKRENGLSSKNFSGSYLDEYNNNDGISTDLGLEMHSFGRVLIDGPMFDEEDQSTAYHEIIIEDDRPRSLFGNIGTSSSFMSNEDCRSEDDGEDESEMLLIKKILERRKSGSNIVLDFTS